MMIVELQPPPPYMYIVHFTCTNVKKKKADGQKNTWIDFATCNQKLESLFKIYPNWFQK